MLGLPMVEFSSFGHPVQHLTIKLLNPSRQQKYEDLEKGPRPKNTNEFEK